MCRNHNIVDAVKDAQIDVFQDCKIARKVLAHRTGQHNNTIDKHANGDSVMSVASFRSYMEAGVEPDLLSLLLPDGFQVVRVPESVDTDHLAELFHEFLQMKTAAHHPESEAGRDISENEAADLAKVHAKIVRAA